MKVDFVRDFLQTASAPAPDLARAALVISRLEYPRVSADVYVGQLDELGAAAAQRLGRLGSDAAPLVRVAALSEYLYGEQGFAGNHERYDDPRNSFLNQVLERRTGIPISLALVYMEVARRAGLRVEGVNFPGHFLLRHEDVILDPFNGGTKLSEADCRRLLHEHLGDKVAFTPGLLEPATSQQILSRMLVNLKRIYVRNRSFPQALAVTEMLLGLDPGAVTELRDRGLLAYHLSHFSHALKDLEAYLKLSPKRDPDGEETASDREKIWEHVKALRRRVAGFN